MMTPETIEIIDYVFTKVHDVIMDPITTFFVLFLLGKFIGFIIKLIKSMDD